MRMAAAEMSMMGGGGSLASAMDLMERASKAATSTARPVAQARAAPTHTARAAPAGGMDKKTA